MCGPCRACSAQWSEHSWVEPCFCEIPVDILLLADHSVVNTQLFYRPFSGTTQMSWWKKSSGLYGAREDNRYTNHPAGRQSIWTNQWPTSIIPPIFMLNSLPAATLPLYPGLGQASNMLICIILNLTSSYATWFTAGGSIRIAVRQLWQTWKLRHWDVITRKL